MIISAITAYTKDTQGRQIIGKDNKLPWQIPEDMKWFKECTMGSPVLMGRKTYESIGRALPGRENYVISRSSEFSPKNVLVFQDPEDAVSHARENRTSELFVIGGQTLYEYFIDRLDRLYVTFIKHNPGYEGDAFFPVWNRTQFRPIERHQLSDPKNGTVVFKIFQRVVYNTNTSSEVAESSEMAYQYNTGALYGHGL